MTRGTVIMAVLALLSALGAYMMRPVELAPPAFQDQGEPLFPEFEDPNVATYLEVKEYDEDSAQLTTFSVKLEGGQWVIPSHNNYPADGTEPPEDLNASSEFRAHLARVLVGRALTEASR